MPTFNPPPASAEPGCVLRRVAEIRTTFGTTESARQLADLLLEMRLAACVQLDSGIDSRYRWQGGVESAGEVRCTVKTSLQRMRECIATMLAHHPYETPELLAAEVFASEAYASWIEESTTAGGYAFEIVIHPRPRATAGEPLEDAWGRWFTLAAGDAASTTPFRTPFEEFYRAISAIERLFMEPDGSFVWTGGEGPQRWQVDGVAAELGGRLQWLQLQGSCPPANFDRILAVTGWPAEPVAMQLVRSGVLLDEGVFRRHAEARWLATARPPAGD